MTLDPGAAALVATMDSYFPALDPTVPGTEMRRRIEAVSSQIPAPPPEPVASVLDRTVPGPNGPIPVRAYRPTGVADDATPPVTMFFHGGGFVLCDLDSHDGVCRAICNASGSLVVAVDYRRAPENRWPAAAEDCQAATAWVAEHAGEVGGAAGPLAIVGDSAGGNLAAVVALMSRDRGGPQIVLQVLAYPMIDHTDDTPSHRAAGEDWLLRSREVMYYWDQYLGDEGDGADPYASPIRAASLAMLPPALVITPECDPLRDEGEAYARALVEAGVAVTSHRYRGMIHGFLSYASVLPAGVEATREIGAAIRGAFTWT